MMNICLAIPLNQKVIIQKWISMSMELFPAGMRRPVPLLPALRDRCVWDSELGFGLPDPNDGAGRYF